ncbi:hypothetical protein [Chachezhania sediminis]|uniref:hypothetical protein n=1 Tax=Chachezhania sediminis TaxID=2599291 RepID=UPI00131AC551|nr:hypothetical protein [Chachezhania sediminis]
MSIDEAPLTLRLRGPFAAQDGAGRDVLPAGRKERALLALLAFAPDRRCLRPWLRDTLWSDRSRNQRITSLRRALANIRKSLGEGADLLGSDREAVWLDPAVRLDRDGTGTLLDGLEAPDPAFGLWLRSVRRTHGPAFPAEAAPRAETEAEERCVIRIASSQGTVPSSPEERHLAEHLAGLLADRMRNHGNLDVTVVPQGATDPFTGPPPLIHFDIRGLIREGRWFVNLRSAGHDGRLFLWAGQLDMPLNFGQILGGTEIAAFSETAAGATIRRLSGQPVAASLPAIAIQTAAQGIFAGNRDQMEAAARQLAQLSVHDSSGMALAWRAYAQVNDVQEYASPIIPARARAAEELADAAVRAGPTNPTVLGLAAHAYLNFQPESEIGAELSRRAVQFSGADPYALGAASQANLIEGDFEAAQCMAERARHIAAPLSYSYCWDVQAAIATLALGRIEEAAQRVHKVVMNRPGYRPALRYQFALATILGNRERAQRSMSLLRMQEQSFTPARLLTPGYPVKGLYAAGLIPRLAEAING